MSVIMRNGQEYGGVDDGLLEDVAELKTDVSELKSNITNLTPIQRGKKTDVSLTAGTYTEVQIDLPTAYASKNDYVVFISIIAYVDPIYLYYIVRSKESTHFVLRMRNNYSSALSVSIDWMTMHV